MAETERALIVGGKATKVVDVESFDERAARIAKSAFDEAFEAGRNAALKDLRFTIAPATSVAPQPWPQPTTSGGAGATGGVYAGGSEGNVINWNNVTLTGYAGGGSGGGMTNVNVTGAPAPPVTWTEF